MRTAAVNDGLPSTAHFWPAVAGIFGAALGAFGLWLANRMLGKAAFQTAINAGFQALTDQLQEERVALRKTLEEERLAWASERAQFRGEILNLTQALDSLKRLLVRHGIDVPVLPPSPAVPMTILEKE